MNLIEWKSETERLAVMYGVACVSRDASAISSAYVALIAHLKADPEVVVATGKDREGSRS